MKATLYLSLFVAAAVPLTSCSSFSKSSRDQRAYAKYDRKSSIARVKQPSQLGRGNSQMPPPQQPSEPVERVETQPVSAAADG